MKKFFSLVLALVMALSLTTVAWGANTITVGATGCDYTSLADAIEHANEGDTILLSAGTYSGENKLTSVKSLIIKGADNYGTILTGGIYLGTDASQVNAGSSVTIEGIAFETTGIFVGDYATVTIQNNKFTNITANAAPSSSSDANAISVAGNDATANIIGNIIDTVAVAGINLRDMATSSITGNTISNTGHNSITIQNDASAVTITGNTLSNWGTSGSGRAMRIQLGASAGTKSVVAEGNAMTHTAAPEEFAKVTEVGTDDTASLSNNYWNGVAPTAAMIDADNAVVATYYTTATGGVLSGLTSAVPSTNNLAKYTLWGAKVAATATGVNYIATDMQLPTLVKAVAPTATNLSGAVAHYVVNGDYFVEATVADCDVYFTVKGKTAPVLYLKQVSTPVYLAVATEFTNFGKACGQVNVTPVAGTKAYTWTTLTGDTVVVGGDLAANYASANAYVLVNGKLASVASNDLYAANVVEHSWTFTRDAAGTPVSAKCVECGATATVYTKFTAVPKGADYIKEGNLFLVINTVPAAGDKVQSAETFDAGIALYVGMSVMAATGAVVLKKREG